MLSTHIWVIVARPMQGQNGAANCLGRVAGRFAVRDDCPALWQCRAAFEDCIQHSAACYHEWWLCRTPAGLSADGVARADRRAGRAARGLQCRCLLVDQRDDALFYGRQGELGDRDFSED